MESDKWCGLGYIAYYSTYNEAIESCNNDPDCTCLEYDTELGKEDTGYYTHKGIGWLPERMGWTAQVTSKYISANLYDCIISNSFNKIY